MKPPFAVAFLQATFRSIDGTGNALNDAGAAGTMLIRNVARTTLMMARGQEKT